ncbi:MAG: class I SAM-dependent methyltransferase [Myxococcota bacterium]|nr:class I SAM-dependent methyltransferase [Myxococcota bacterium]
MKLLDRVCPLCGSQDDSQVVAEANYDESGLGQFAFASRKTPEFMHFRLVRCPDCDVLYANPAPALDWLRDRYHGAGFDSASESSYAARSYARELRRIAGALPSRDGALDIGAGDGAFLEQLLANGFSSVVGLEPSTAPIDQARPELRALLREGFFEGGDFQDASLSLITCCQTLEHTDDPLGLCNSAFRILKPGGALFTIAHDSRALSAKLLGVRSPIYDIEHLQLHSRRSLHFMLEHAGFERIEVRALRNDYPLSYWLKLMPLEVAVKERLANLLKRLHLDGVVMPMWPGNLVASGFKPGA